MTIYSAFAVPTLGMESQAHALDTISNNIANISTGGFKATETRFSTLLSRPLFQQSDLGGLRPVDFNRIANQGLFVQGNQMDVAINGTGFFVLNTQVDGQGETLYGRDGTFDVRVGETITVTTSGTTQTATEITGPEGGTIESQEGYLVDKNGHFVQGWQAEADGSFNTAGSLSALRIDQFAFVDNFVSTTFASLNLNLPTTDQVGDPAHTYAIDIIDSLGDHQSIQLSFSKADSLDPLIWQVTATTSQDPVAQVDTVTLSGTVETGDSYSIDVDGEIASYTVTAADATLDDVRDGLLNAISLNPNFGNLVIAAAGTGLGELTLTARDAGTAFASTTTATNVAAQAQVEDITVSGTLEVGDTYSAVINGTTYSYTVVGTDASIDDVATQLAILIDADPAVTATAVGPVVTVTAAVAGTPFTAIAGTPTNGGATLDESILVANVTPNLGIDDQDNVATTTTANVEDTITSAATLLTFDGAAQLVSPTEIAMDLTFAGGGTATFDLDISDFTSFAGDFNPVNYERDGFGRAAMVGISFDSLGQVLGKFQDGTNRAIYRLPIAVFSNPNGLEMRNGNLLAESEQSGEARITAAGTDGFATFVPETRELSNVDLADEFTRMIKTQTVYNACATTFRTVDEMTEIARDLKR